MRGEAANGFARGGSFMKAVLALVIIYVAMFFLAIQCKPNSKVAQPKERVPLIPQKKLISAH
jgi:hypothetical protein